MNSSISYKDMLEAKIRQTQQEDIMETVRRRTEFADKVSVERVSNDRRLQDFSREGERISQERQRQGNMGYHCRYERLVRRRDAFWK